MTKLEFCEQFEASLNQYEIMKIIEDSLTNKGHKLLNELSLFLADNAEKYLEYINEL